MDYFSQYSFVQSIAKTAMERLKDFIQEGITEREIVVQAEEIMKSQGVNEFWYHGVGAFVHVGKRSVISESGKYYKPTESVVGRHDIVTIDLSPEFNGYWGDYARTYIILDGNVITDDELIQSEHRYAPEFKSGMNTEKKLHRIFMEYITPSKTFEDVYLYMNEIIDEFNYKNLDFAGNLGHTIEFNKDNRIYFEMGNKTKLGDVAYFTFEPHIKCRNGRFGFKREDIYYYCNDELFVL